MEWRHDFFVEATAAAQVMKKHFPDDDTHERQAIVKEIG